MKGKSRKRLARMGRPPEAPSAANEEWALDFISDALVTGRSVRVLSVVDAFTRECLELEVDSSLSSRRVTRTLDRIIEQRGAPEVIRCDNGLKASALVSFSLNRHSSPGSPVVAIGFDKNTANCNPVVFHVKGTR